MWRRVSLLIPLFIFLSTPVGAGEWKLVWEDDFERGELGSDWLVLSGEAGIEQGRLHVVGVASSVITTRGFPPDVRLEFDGGVLPGYGACDLTPSICCNEWFGNSSGYWLAFGAYYGQRNMLMYHGKKIIDEDPEYALRVGTEYHMVATKEAGNVSLSANGNVILEREDDDPLEGPGFDRIALTTWTGIWVDNVRVYARDRSAEDVSWLVHLWQLPLFVRAGKMYPAKGVEVGEAAAAIDAFNSGDIAAAWRLFSELPDGLLKAAGLAGCLGNLDYEKGPGQAEYLAELFESLAERGSESRRSSLLNHALAARLRGDEQNGRCNQVNGIRLIKIGPKNNPYYVRAMYDVARLLYWRGKEGGTARNMAASREFFREILESWPDHSISRQYAGEQVPWGPEFSEYPEGTPAWAAALHEAYARNVAIVEWWVENRQKEKGEFGGGLGDDVELFRTWQPLAAISTGSPTLRKGIERLCDGVWNHPAVVNGYWGDVLDVEHGAEYTGDTQPAMIFLDYGEPLYYERNLETAHLIRDVFVDTNERGFRQFKTVELGGKELGSIADHNADVPYDARAMKAVMWLAWAGNPDARKLLLDWADTWLDAAMSEEGGKPSGVVPAAIWYPEGTIVGPHGNWWKPHLGWDYYDWPFSTFKAYDTLNCAYYFDPDPRYLVPIQRTIDLAWSSPRLEDRKYEEGSREWVVRGLQNYGFLLSYSIPTYRWVTGDTAYDENLRIGGKAYVRYLIDHDLAAFTGRIDEIARSRRYNFELETREVMATDRANVGGVDDIFGAYTGAMRRWNDMGLPTSAVTWVAEDTDFAALVQTASQKRLKAKVYQFKEEPMRLGMRFWQLVPGKYEMVFGSEEVTDSGWHYAAPRRREFEILYRGRAEFVELPPRQVYSVDVRLVEEVEVPEELPDLAIGRDDVRIATGADGVVEMTVQIHNIGSTKSGAFEVRVYDASGGTLIDRATLPPLDAPTDLLPKQCAATFEIPRRDLAQGWQVRLHPADPMQDHNPANNSRSGFLPE